MELLDSNSQQEQAPQLPTEKKNDAADFLQVMKESSKRAVQYIFLFSAAINILTLMLPIYSLQVFDRVLSSGSLPTLSSLTILAVFALTLYAIFNSVREFIVIRLSSWLDEKFNDKVFRLSVNHSSLTGQRMGSQFVMEANAVKSFVTGQQIFSLFDLPWSFVFIFIIYLVSPEISLLVIIGAVILFGLTYYKDFKTKPKIKETNDINSANFKRGDEFIRHSEVIESMGMLPNVYKLWKDEHMHVQERVRETAFLSSRLSSISKALRMVLQIFIIALGVYLALNKQMTFGGIIACSILSGKALGPFDSIMAIWSSFGNFRDSYAKLKTFVTTGQERPETMALGKPNGDIVADKVVFLKPGTVQPILKGLSIHIDAGDVVGIIGPSGSGKSTLIKILSGIYKPNMGMVRVDNGNIFQRNREDIGKYIGYLPQSIDLLKGTVKQNITRFDPNATDEAAVEVAKKTGVHELILGLPEGYHSMLGEGGIELSGGQKQRVGLARAFYGDLSMIFLDEPNANLDEVGERMLITAIQTAKQEGRTILMISHKPSIVNVVDKIIVIRDGAIMDFGPRDQIMQKYTRAGINATIAAKQATAEQKASSEISEIVEDIKNKKTDD